MNSQKSVTNLGNHQDRKSLLGRWARRFAPLLLAVGLTVSGGCSSSDPESEPSAEVVIPEGCNPLAADWDCLLPYPSDVYLVEDATMPSGHRVELPEPAKIIGKSGDPVDLFAVHTPDGFSPGAQILTLFPDGVDPADLVFHTDDVTRTLGSDTTTLLLDAETGEQILHFAELDPRAKEDARRGLLIRPMVRLRDATRYIVAIRALRTPQGDPIRAPTGFGAIRDGTAAGHPVLGPLASHYDASVFPVLETAGVDRADLQIAWDFTTRTKQNSTADMLAMRDDLMAKLAAAPPALQVVEVLDDASDVVARKISATVTVPLYVDSPETESLLNRDGEGRVVAVGETQVPFTILIPRSVADRAPGSPPARVFQFGHGFFGSQEEAESFPADFAEENGMVVVAADWWGMSEADRVPLVDAIVANPNAAFKFTDRVHQGMANFITLAAAIKGPLASLPELSVGGSPAYDPTNLYFYGISMGHVLGGTYLTLSPHIQRGVLSSGGADFSLIMFRSRSFSAFLVFVQMLLPDALDQQKFSLLIQGSFDRVDPITYAPHLFQDPLSGAQSDRRLLMHHGINDANVPSLAAHLHARALGIPLLQPSPRTIVGIEPVDGPVDGSALVEFDFGVEPVPVEATPPTRANDVHDSVRSVPAGMRQVDGFFQPGGVIEHTCSGPCDPE